MWLCEYCDAENVEENNICKDCGNANTLSIKKPTKPAEYEFCTSSMRLKKWGKILMIACFGIGTAQLATIISISLWIMNYDITNADYFMRAMATTNAVSFSLSSFLTFLTWIGGGILIKLALDALAIIVQSSHLNIKSKTKEGE